MAGEIQEETLGISTRIRGGGEFVPKMGQGDNN